MWISFLDLLQCPNITSTAIYILHNTIHQDTFIESECKSGPMKQDVLHRTLLRLWLRKWLQDKPTDMYIDFWREVLNSINVIWGNNKVIPWGKQVTLRIILQNKPRWNEGHISVAAEPIIPFEVLGSIVTGSKIASLLFDPHGIANESYGTTQTLY